MTVVKRSALALILFTSLAGISPAFAAEEPPIVMVLLKNWESQLKVKPTYQALSTESDGSVVIDGLTVNMPVQGDAAGKMTLTIGKTRLSGVTDQGNGLFEVAKAEFTDTKMDMGSTDVAFTISMPQSSAENWYVKALGDNPAPGDFMRANMNVARKMSSGPITMAAAGQTFSADSYEMNWDGDPATGAGKTDFKISNIAIPEAAIATLDPSGTLKQLGYSTLSFDIGGNGNIDIATEKMGFDFDVYYAGKDIGTLKIGAGAGEIPMALIAELQKLEGQAQPDPNKFMPLVQGIQVSRVTLRFEDKSITKKVLPMLAAMQGKDEATMVANAGAMLQLGLAELKNPAFTQKAVEAVNAYLKDPQSLTILAKPAQPVTVQQLMALDPANPGAAIDQLGVTISAND
ncbi:hypothetical protein [Taklimakanibacter lacteus]|uniref:hypothetical protein n=1 Tax=Taklimakanibacter lacteus TaxID=2268456 RepID=UPI000E65FA27